jgi:hypothetical protein
MNSLQILDTHMEIDSQVLFFMGPVHRLVVANGLKMTFHSNRPLPETIIEDKTLALFKTIHSCVHRSDDL